MFVIICIFYCVQYSFAIFVYFILIGQGTQVPRFSMKLVFVLTWFAPSFFMQFVCSTSCEVAHYTEILMITQTSPAHNNSNNNSSRYAGYRSKSTQNFLLCKLMDVWIDGWMDGVTLAPNLTATTSFVTLRAFTS